MKLACQDGEEGDAAALRTLIDRDLTVALQPIYALSSGALIGFEALCRGWEAAGFSGPHALLDAAERLGLLADLEERQAVRAVELMAGRFTPPRPQLFINLDLRVLSGRTPFFDRLEAALDRLGYPRKDLCIELSERNEKKDIEALRRQIDLLRRRGFRFALDDFGNGVSDVLALYHFDIDFLKLDRFLTDGIAHDRRKRFFVARLVELAHLLGQQVVAEGVESAADLAVCRELHCDMAQGFHLGRPSAAPRISARSVARTRPSRASPPHLRGIAERVPAWRAEAPIRSLIEAIQRNAASACYPVVDDRDQPVGVVSGAAVSAFLAGPFAHALLQNSGFHMPIGDLAAPCPTVDVALDPARLSQIVAGTEAEHIIVTSEMRYFGIISAANLLRLFQQIQLREALEKNPLSGLPGNRAIERFLHTAIRASECDRSLIYFDFNDFKPFNDAYGFQAGDRAIELFAEILRGGFACDTCFLGHVGGDDFFAGAIGEHPSCVKMRVDQVLDSFRQAALRLYTPEDRARGFIHQRDRSGAEARIDLLTCCAAVLSLEQGSAPATAEEALLQIAELKRAAKGRRGVAIAWRRPA